MSKNLIPTINISTIVKNDFDSSSSIKTIKKIKENFLLKNGILQIKIFIEVIFLMMSMVKKV